MWGLGGRDSGAGFVPSIGRLVFFDSWKYNTSGFRD